MAEDGGKPKEPGADDPSVLGSLPATRSTRLSRRARDDTKNAAPRKAGTEPAETFPAPQTAPGVPETPAHTAATAAKAEAAAAKAKPATSRKAPAKPKATTSKAATGAKARTAAREASAKRRAPAARTASAPKKASAAAGATSAQATDPSAGVTPLAAGDKPRPRPVRAGHPTLAEPVADAAERRRTPPESGTDLVRTVVQAAGELVSIGATVGGQILKRAADKLPRKP